MARVARGDCQREVAEAASEDGIELGPQRFSWLCQQGHLALPAESPARSQLDQIFNTLQGDLNVLSDARTTALTGDFLHKPTGTLIEVDEHQHFSSARLITLNHYPGDARLGFDLDHYKALCKRWKRDADKAFAHKEAKPFPGSHGRQRQRAYYDALRDLAAPAMGQPPLIRIDAALDNGRAAYASHRERLVALLG
jgi:hypothetical protein